MPHYLVGALSMESLSYVAGRLVSILQLAGFTPLNIIVFAAICGIFWYYPAFFRRALRSFRALWDRIPNHAASAIIIAALFPLAVRLLLLPVLPPPVPMIEDEFSNLLAADTFSHWRLTNPTHPLWPFFESFHIFHQPTYMSMYPPLPAMVLAFGKILFGQPWWGEFLSVGAMCGAICWLLEAFMPAGWALLGSLAVGVEFGITFYWMNSYWGCTVAPIGGCLLVGSVARLLFRRSSRQPARNGVLAALGIAILANSRPWEGLVLSVATCIAMLYWLAFSKSERARSTVKKALLPCVGVLALAGAATMYYCWRVTGNAFLLPYQLDRNTYAVASMFVWQPNLPAHNYRHEVMRRFYIDFEPAYQNAERQHTFQGWLREQPNRYRMLKDRFFGNFFVILILAYAPALLRKPSARFLLLILSGFLAGIALQRYIAPHYLAPILAVTAPLEMIALRHLNAFRWRRRRLGQALAIAVIACGSIALVRYDASQPQPSEFARQRAAMERQLEAAPDKQLVIVRYEPNHNVQEEWVYNAADIDASKVVWARDVSPAENVKLLNYFHDRKASLLEPDIAPMRLQPYR